jgi:putative spermidine/putrescine transport system substrate-binding protein
MSETTTPAEAAGFGFGAIAQLLILLGACAACSDAPPGDADELVITVGGGTWERAQKLSYFDPFTRATGIDVVMVPEDHAKLLASVKVGRPAADLTSIPGSHLAAFARMNALEPIDYTQFADTTLSNLPPDLRQPYAVGSILYSTVIAFSTEAFPPQMRPKSWADFYDVEAFPGPRALPTCEKMVDGGLLETALLADGVVPEDIYPIDMERAFAKINQLRPHVTKWWTSGSEAPQSLIDGEVTLAAAYSGRISAARDLGAPLGFSWQDSLLQHDYWVVMKGSPNKEHAMRFLAYASRAEPQAAFSQAISFGPVNTSAYELLPEALSNSLPGSSGLAAKQLRQDYDWWNATDDSGRTHWETALQRCVADNLRTGRPGS